MGIYDRDYYRREGQSYLGSFTERGKVCKALILVNVVVFILQLVLVHREHVQVPVAEVERSPRRFLPEGDDAPQGGYLRVTQTDYLVNDWLELDVGKVAHGQVWRVFTYAFLHDTMDVMHIIFNMLALWWFGTDVEDLYGPREFLALYLVAGTLGGIAFTVLNLVAGSPEMKCVGASGAVLAAVVLCAIHYPNRPVRLFFLIPMPLWVLVLLFVAWDGYTLLSRAETTTAVSVHLTGAAFAYLYYKFHWNLTSLWAGMGTWRWPKRRPRLRVYRDEEPATPVSAAAPTPARDVDEHLEAKVDAVLEKVSRHGQDSLTDSEREILFKASEVYKKRRT